MKLIQSPLLLVLTFNNSRMRCQQRTLPFWKVVRDPRLQDLSIRRFFWKIIKTAGFPKRLNKNSHQGITETMGSRWWMLTLVRDVCMPGLPGIQFKMSNKILFCFIFFTNILLYSQFLTCTRCIAVKQQCVFYTNTNTQAMIPTYGRVLSTIEKALWELVEEYQGAGRSL